MADGNCATVFVDLLHVNVEMLHRENGLRSKGLIDLVEIDVVLCKTRLFKNLKLMGASLKK